MPSDIEIAQAAKLKRIAEVAKNKLGIADEHLEPFGHYKAKVSLEYLDSLPNRPNAKLILVTAMTPTPAGEGKTTTTVNVAAALAVEGFQVLVVDLDPQGNASTALAVDHREGEDLRVPLVEPAKQHLDELAFQVRVLDVGGSL